MMQIGEAARLSDVSAKLIRYYEGIDLLDKSQRDTNAYRLYDNHHIYELRFIKRARTLGFPIDEIRELLDLWRNKSRPSREVRAIARRHHKRIEEGMLAYQSIHEVLDHLISNCSGDERPECPILDELSFDRPIRVQRKKSHARSIDNDFKSMGGRKRRSGKSVT